MAAEHSLRDRAAWEEHQRSGLCQACQDALRLACDPEDSDIVYRVRTGAVAAMSGACGLAETVVLPFRFTVPGGPFAWDTTRIVRVGSWIAPVDWTDEWAGAMADVLEGHLFRFHEFPRFEEYEPALRPVLGGTELLVGINARALVQVHRCLRRVCPAALCVGVDAVYEAAFGHPLGRLGAFVASNGWTSWSGTHSGTPSALRLCSWIGAVLSVRAGEHERLFDIALDSVRDPLGLAPDETGPGCEACAVRALDPH